MACAPSATQATLEIYSVILFADSPTPTPMQGFTPDPAQTSKSGGPVLQSFESNQNHGGRRGDEVRESTRVGSFHHQAKIVRKPLISTVFWLLYDFLFVKNGVNVTSTSNKQKKNRNKNNFVLASWRSLTKWAGSGSVSQRYGDSDLNLETTAHCHTRFAFCMYQMAIKPWGRTLVISWALVFLSLELTPREKSTPQRSWEGSTVYT
jgi:hypothetical protein